MPVGAMSNELPPLIPREVLLGDPKRWQPTISPDGTRLAYLAPDEQDALQIWVRTLGSDDDRCVSAERHSIWNYEWAWDSETILYGQDTDGDQNSHTSAIERATGNVRDLTPWRGVRCHYTMPSPERPGEILAILNVRDRSLMDLWRIDLRTGAAVLEVENPGDVASWIADRKLFVRGANAFTRDGGFEVRVRADANALWRTLLRSLPDEEVASFGFSEDSREIFLKSSVASDTLRVVARDIDSGREREIAGMEGFDAEQLMIHPTRRVIDAVSFEPGRRRWSIIDSAIVADFEAIARLDDGDFRVANRDLADRRWVIEFESPHRPIRYYLWDRSSKRAEFLFSHRPDWEGHKLAEMRPITYSARDGMELHGYLSLPPGAEPRNLPMVVYVHGGPWTRDYWALNTWVQFLANRGYAVLQPNYRGSTGYGRQYLHAGDRQWGRLMQDDLTDAVTRPVAQDIADPDRVAIFGGSYGGYAALAGAAFTPDFYRCAVDLVGPSNLFTHIRAHGFYWNVRSIWNARTGNPEDPADAELLTNASPLFAAERIKIPILIAQGANDPIVKQAESDQIVAAIKKNGGTATYVLYPDEGHGFVQAPNRMDFMARVERFLAKHLGGRYEPLEGDRIPGSSAIVREIRPQSRESRPG
jgi:dipeptidyl aminopeptidase/acylaminoacyl peptidase